jgi:hypothetical protein
LTEQIKKDWKLWKNCGNVSQFKRFAECAVSSPWSAKEGQGGRVEVSVALLTRTQREKAHLTKNIKLQCRKTVFFYKKNEQKRLKDHKRLRNALKSIEIQRKRKVKRGMSRTCTTRRWNLGFEVDEFVTGPVSKPNPQLEQHMNSI